VAFRGKPRCPFTFWQPKLKTAGESAGKPLAAA
jgi:hypothetical protein